MIERLFEAAQAPCGTSRIDQRVGNHLRERCFTHVMRTRESRENSIAGKQLECADVQFVIPAERIAEATFCFREGWGIENDEVVLRA